MIRLIYSIIINLIVIGGTGYTLWWYFHIHTKGETPAEKRTIFRFYTYLSNIFSAIASVIVLIAELLHISQRCLSLPGWVTLLRFAATTSVTVTILTVVLFLAPNMGWKELFKQDGAYMHAVGPIVAILAFTVVEKDSFIHFPLSLLGASTVVVYAVVYFCKVILRGEENGGWPDFYGFNKTPGMWKISMPVMIVFGCVLSLVMAFLHNI